MNDDFISSSMDTGMRVPPDEGGAPGGGGVGGGGVAPSMVSMRGPETYQGEGVKSRLAYGIALQARRQRLAAALAPQRAAQIEQLGSGLEPGGHAGAHLTIVASAVGSVISSVLPPRALGSSWWQTASEFRAPLRGG